MGKLPIKIAINYLKNSKNQNCKLTKIFVTRQDINYRKCLLTKKRAFLENKLTESIDKLKDLWKALRSLGLPSKTSSCGVNALKINSKF